MNPQTASTFFQCPECQGELDFSAIAEVRCPSCGAAFGTSDGIVDFVAGRFGTELDNFDYDAFYRLDDEHSEDVYRRTIDAAGERWPKSFGETVEIGCGTVSFSSSLAQAGADHLVLTDVSPKMLRLCRHKLDRRGLLREGQVLFVTYSSNEKCLKSQAFDTCIGSSVLHHIADVKNCLVDLRRILKPNGCAFFLEPGRPFHEALVATFAEIVARYISQGEDLYNPDLVRMSNWMCELRCNILHYGDVEFLAPREDKHVFVREDIVELARDVGFGGAEALMWRSDPTGANAATSYLEQTGVSKDRIADIVTMLSSGRIGYFSRLGPNDVSALYLLYFSNKASNCTRASSAPSTELAKSTPIPIAPDELRLRWSLQLTARHRAEGITVDVEGWCVARADVKWLRLRHHDTVCDLPVWRPRLDVHVAINADGIYSPLNAISCGIDAPAHFPSWPIGDLDLAIDAVMMDGSTCAIARAAKVVLEKPVTFTR